jgi:hypothetical protein
VEEESEELFETVRLLLGPDTGSSPGDVSEQGVRH